MFSNPFSFLTGGQQSSKPKKKAAATKTNSNGSTSVADQSDPSRGVFAAPVVGELHEYEVDEFETTKAENKKKKRAKKKNNAEEKDVTTNGNTNGTTNGHVKFTSTPVSDSTKPASSAKPAIKKTTTSDDYITTKLMELGYDRVLILNTREHLERTIGMADIESIITAIQQQEEQQVVNNRRAKKENKKQTTTAAAAAAPAPVTTTTTTPASQPKSQPQASTPSQSPVNTDDHTKKGLETAARSFTPLARDSSSLIEQWVEKLEKNLVPGLLETFIESDVVEILVRKLLTEAYNSATTVPPRTLDPALAKFFAFVFSGRANEQKQLIDTLKSLARSLDSAPNRNVYIDKIIKVITATKRSGSTNNEVTSILKEVESKIDLPSGPSAFEQTVQAELQRLNTQLSEFTANNTPLLKLWNNAVNSGTNVMNSELKLNKFSKSFTKSPQHNLQLTFHLLEKEIQDSIIKTVHQMEEHTNQRSVIASQKSTLEQNKQKELSSLLETEKAQNEREKELNKRKAQLLAELNQVEINLKTLNESKQKNSDRIKTINENYTKSADSLTSMVNETNTRLIGCSNDKKVADAIHSLVVSTYERLNDSSSSSLKKLASVTQNATQHYIIQAREHLISLQALYDFLSNRIAFFEQKINTAATEKAAMTSFGLTNEYIATEQQFIKLLKQDQRVQAAVMKQVNSIIEKLVTLPQSPVASSQPLEHINAAYAQLVSALDTKKVTFDITKLRTKAASLQQLLQKQEEKAKQAAATAAAAATTGTASVSTTTTTPSSSTPSTSKAATAAPAAVKSPKAVGVKSSSTAVPPTPVTAAVTSAPVVAPVVATAVTATPSSVAASNSKPSSSSSTSVPSTSTSTSSSSSAPRTWSAGGWGSKPVSVPSSTDTSAFPSLPVSTPPVVAAAPASASASAPVHSSSSSAPTSTSTSAPASSTDLLATIDAQAKPKRQRQRKAKKDNQ